MNKDLNVFEKTVLIVIILLVLCYPIIIIVDSIDSQHKENSCKKIGMTYNPSKNSCWVKTTFNDQTGEYNYKYAEVPQ